KESFGNRISFFTPQHENLQEVRLALVSMDKGVGEAVRRQLYTMSFPFDKLQVMDFGDARRKQVSFLVPVIRELMDSNIIPIIISNSASMVQAQYRAFKSIKESISQVLVDELAPFTADASSGADRYYF